MRIVRAPNGSDGNRRLSHVISRTEVEGVGDQSASDRRIERRSRVCRRSLRLQVRVKRALVGGSRPPRPIGQRVLDPLRTASDRIGASSPCSIALSRFVERERRNSEFAASVFIHQLRSC